MASFSTALSGLRASTNSLNITGSNIANANTTAYKSGALTFSDVLLSAFGRNGAGFPLQIGSGVKSAAVFTNFSQAGVKESEITTHMAIEGNGFFVVRDPGTGIQAYSRAGDFVLDKNGYLVLPKGDQAQGYAAVNGVIPGGAPLTSLQIPIGQTLPPSETANAIIRANLDATDAVGTAFTSNVPVYDSLGILHTLNLVFTKTAPLSYSMTATLGTVPVTTGSPTVFTFDAFGKLTAPAAPGPLAIVPDATDLTTNFGSSLTNINLQLYDNTTTPATGYITNFADRSAVAFTSQDGYAPGSTSGIQIDQDGIISAAFSNGQTRKLGQMALALFSSQDGVAKLGGNLYGETNASGPLSISRPNAGGRGSILGGALEESNVDLANEFTNLIVAQRNFQANSRVITTINQTLQDLLQII